MCAAARSRLPALPAPLAPSSGPGVVAGRAVAIAITLHDSAGGVAAAAGAMRSTGRGRP